MFGHAKTILRGKDCESITAEQIMRMNGVLWGEFIAPSNLLIPIIPYRSNGKLMFPLCRACADALNVNACTHTDDEKAIEGVYVIDEIKLALEYKYRIKKIYEIWLFDTKQYNPETNEDGIFSQYMRTFLKIKMENSGWPENVQSESEKDEYIRMCEEVHGLKLDKSKIKNNKSLRAIAKLCANR